MEPIAVDAPVKVPTIPGPKTLPSLKAEPPKPDSPKAADPIGSGWALPSRRHLTIGIAAVCSLIAGIAAVRMLSPTSPESTANAPTQPLTSAPASTPPTSTPSLPPVKTTPDPLPNNTGLNIPAVGTLPLPPTFTNTPSVPTATIERTNNTVANNLVSPVAPPNNFVPQIAPVMPDSTTKPPPYVPVTPDGQFRSADAKKEAQPYVPPINPNPNNAPPVVPNIYPVNAQEPVKPAAPTTLPLPPLPTGNTVPLPGTNPVIEPKKPDVPAFVPLPMNVTPTVPLPPSVTPGYTIPPSGAPSGSQSVPLVPLIDPANSTTPRTIEYTKPVNSPEVRPALTSFDVDLYDPRLGDSYESISKEYYNDTRYGGALREFNRNKSLQNAGPVEVPPMHVLRKRYPQFVGSATSPTNFRGLPVDSTNFPSAPPPVRPVAGTTPETWTGNGSTNSINTDLTFRSSAGSYRVPVGGTTLKQIAKDTLGSDARWSEIWDLNRQITDPSLVLPSGTEVKLPPGAKVGS